MKFFLTACLVFFILPVYAQPTDSTIKPQDFVIDSLKPVIIFTDIYKPFTDSNFLLNAKGVPQAISVSLKKNNEKDEIYFYIILTLLMILAGMKTLYSRYITTLFRVFFNTSLRQSQLTDQLEQAKLQSLISNIYFIITAAFYVFIILRYFSLKGGMSDWYLIGLIMLGIGGSYLVKYLSLRIVGWVTGFRVEADTYIFIIFLHNKITGFMLLPFIVLIAFSFSTIAYYALCVSLIMLALILLMRFYRSYSLLRSRLKISGLHFILYVLALEILPLALIYKQAMYFLGI